MAFQKGAKEQKTAKDPRDKTANSMNSREDQTRVEVRLQQLTWSSQLKVDRAAIPWNALIKEFQRGHSAHIAEALE